MKNIKYFRGVFPSDLLPNKIKNQESGIINFQSSTEPGSHWVCYYNNPNNKYVEYFDSYGLPPPEKIKHYLKTSEKLIQWNSTQYQMNNSAACGYYCINYIKNRLKGINMYDILYSFTQQPSVYNENILFYL